MKRETLVDAITKAVEEMSYTPFYGFENRAAEITAPLPIALIEPLVLKSTSGIEQGATIYNVSLHLMRRSGKGAAIQKESVWQQIENDAFTLRHILLKNSEIRNVRSFRCVPAEFSLTSKGELSMAVKFEVETLFLNRL